MLILGGVIKDIPENVDLNDYRTAGLYRVSNNNTAATISNKPYSVQAFVMVVLPGIQSGRAIQIVFANSLSASTPPCIRSFSTAWGLWYQFTLSA